MYFNSVIQITNHISGRQICNNFWWKTKIYWPSRFVSVDFNFYNLQINYYQLQWHYTRSTAQLQSLFQLFVAPPVCYVYVHLVKEPGLSVAFLTLNVHCLWSSSIGMTVANTARSVHDEVMLINILVSQLKSFILYHHFPKKKQQL